ncbi:MAG: hypothetical protein KBD27_03910 [Candidatus Moranbacteria bacterium]|nr:hypothetical protein [Candidatus Moranbacteria bacterium]
MKCTSVVAGILATVCFHVVASAEALGVETHVARQATGEWREFKVDLVYDQPQKTLEGRSAIARLQELLRGSFRPLNRWDRGPYRAGCAAQLREWNEPDLAGANFRTECWSGAMWPGDDLQVISGGVDTPEDFVWVMEQWRIVHQARLLRPQPK